MRPIGFARVIDGRAELQPYFAPLEFVGDRAGVRDGPGEAVELGHDERVAPADCSQCLGESGALRLRPVRPWSR